MWYVFLARLQFVSFITTWVSLKKKFNVISMAPIFLFPPQFIDLKRLFFNVKNKFYKTAHQWNNIPVCTQWSLLFILFKEIYLLQFVALLLKLVLQLVRMNLFWMYPMDAALVAKKISSDLCWLRMEWLYFDLISSEILISL